MTRPVNPPSAPHAGIPRAPTPIRQAQRPGQQPGYGTNRSFATGKAVTALMIREMATRYGRSPGGYVWALLEPMGVILIMAIGFSVMLRSPPIGNSFILFYATGFLPFTLFQSLSKAIARSISFSRALLMYPAVTWVDAMLARFVLNSLTGILVTLVICASLLAVTDTRVALDGGPILTSFGMTCLLGLSIGVFNCAVDGLFPVWKQFWSIISRPLVLLSGVIFMYEDLPAKVREILWYNPLVHITATMRDGFYPTYNPDYISVTYCVLFSLIFLFFGIILMARFHRDILNN
ncbi:ABC transporter permease [Pelagimonas varians]|uniref:ABC transporter permease n=1 Tax=Pelagimonas varians TaxID=696760 RepID=UPI000D8E02A0|nr:ABC transporter permease [Pelagimonas varians]PYG26322.1 capsular polysaccharide transport system permease protein [Pelagimonas varians]